MSVPPQFLAPRLPELNYYRVRRDYGSVVHLARDRLGGCIASGLVLVVLVVLLFEGKPIWDPLVLLVTGVGVLLGLRTLFWKDEVMLDLRSGVLRERRGAPPPAWRELPLGKVEAVERVIAEWEDSELGTMTEHHVMLRFRGDAHPPLSVWFPLSEARASRFHRRLAASLGVEAAGPTKIDPTQ